MRTLLVLVLAGCGGPIEPEIGWRPLMGEEHLTPKKGISFWWCGPCGSYTTPEEVGKAIDDLYVEWLALDLERFGGNLSPSARLSAIQRIDIQLVNDWKVSGNGHDGYTMGIYWPWQHQIDIALAGPLRLDPWWGMLSEGLQGLRHEWSHVLHGAYHP